MPLRRDYPADDIARHVEFVAQRSERDHPVVFRVAPAARVEILFNFGDAWSIGETAQKLRCLENVDVLPARRSTYWQSAGPHIEWLIVALTPLGCRSILGCELAALWSDKIGPSFPLPQLFHEAHAVLQSEPDPDRRLRIALELVRENIQAGMASEFLDAVHCARYEAVSTVRSLSQSLGIGERQLRNRFSRSIGIGPKEYLGILRFNRHLAAIHPAPWIEERQASCDEMYDESHAIREFRRHLGMTPAQYRKLKRTDESQLIYVV